MFRSGKERKTSEGTGRHRPSTKEVKGSQNPRPLAQNARRAGHPLKYDGFERMGQPPDISTVEGRSSSMYVADEINERNRTRGGCGEPPFGSSSGRDDREHDHSQQYEPTERTYYVQNGAQVGHLFWNKDDQPIESNACDADPPRNADSTVPRRVHCRPLYQQSASCGRQLTLTGLITIPKTFSESVAVEWDCPKHGSSSFGFAFLCAHLAAGIGTGFHPVPDPDEEDEARPPALCDACEVRRMHSGAYQSSRVCAMCYDEIKAQRAKLT